MKCCRVDCPLFQHVDPAPVAAQYRPQHVHIVEGGGKGDGAWLQEQMNGQWVNVRQLTIRKEDGKCVVVLSEEGDNEPL